MSSHRRNLFDADAFRQGLQEMSRAIQASRVLAPYRPLELIASGGIVSVMCLRNRTSSQDLDYFLHPRALGADYERMRTELLRIIAEVASKLGYTAAWANDDVRLFLTLLDDPTDLFNRSKAQNVILYQDQNLIIFAVLWEWVLVRKLKRTQMPGRTARREDRNDCVSICRLLYQRQPGALNAQMLTQFDHTDREPPVLEQTVTNLRRLLLHFLGLDPFESGMSQRPTITTRRIVADHNRDGPGRDDDNETYNETEAVSQLLLRVQHARQRRDQLIREGNDPRQVVSSLASTFARMTGIPLARAIEYLSH